MYVKVNILSLCKGHWQKPADNLTSLSFQDRSVSPRSSPLAQRDLQDDEGAGLGSWLLSPLEPS